MSSPIWNRPLPGARRLLLPGALALLVVLLVGTAVRGAYIVDENNYLATLLSLRAGRLSLPGTDGLTPSAELYWFDPLAKSRTPRTPVVSTAPPLWAFLAWPFSPFGWFGLVALNALAFAATIWMVQRQSRAFSQRRTTPWIAAAAVLLGGFSIEYAQGVWPHSLTMALAAASLVLAARARQRERLGPALAAGLALGLATGIRYQNIVFAVAVGLGLLLFGRRRLPSAALFTLGVALPLLAASALNRARLGWWNPVSKGPGYVSFAPPAEGQSGRLTEGVRVLYAKLIDFSSHPPMGGGASSSGADRWRWEPDPALGAYLVHGAVKKALLQSAPWLAMALVVLLLAWRPRAQAPPGLADEARALSIPVAALLLLFALSGFSRQDGLCANQRYLLELVPAGALALGLGLDRLELPRPALLAGALAASATAVFVLWPDLDPRLRVRGLLLIPLLLAGTSVLVLLALRLGLDHLRALVAAMAVLTGACLGWAAAVHLGDDLPAAYRRRLGAAALAERWDAVLPARAALFVHFAGRDASAPLHLGRDLLLMDPWLDGGQSAPRVAAELLASGRRVFLDLALVPAPLAKRISAGHDIRVALESDRPIWEIVPRPRP